MTAAAAGPSSSGRFEVGNLGGALLRLALEAFLDGHAGHERVADEAVGGFFGVPHGCRSNPPIAPPAAPAWKTRGPAGRCSLRASAGASVGIDDLDTPDVRDPVPVIDRQALVARVGDLADDPHLVVLARLLALLVAGEDDLEEVVIVVDHVVAALDLDALLGGVLVLELTRPAGMPVGVLNRDLDDGLVHRSRERVVRREPALLQLPRHDEALVDRGLAAPLATTVAAPCGLGSHRHGR